ncbi:hypothetical protein [Pseudomonas hamedanensis]|uniref:Uncharacterized protein n=1 Tax=Pseudomonas hamedanensis TaxID=2745504 RepID=A0A9E6THZ1_9PSED|nr:hypothetical protein [Pseudomonas hamedanensis]QXI19010.1 hypothetical protein HU739_008470 [Pseudomonas hamedanensis]
MDNRSEQMPAQRKRNTKTDEKGLGAELSEQVPVPCTPVQIANIADLLRMPENDIDFFVERGLIFTRQAFD